MSKCRRMTAMPQYVYLALVCGLRRHRVPAAPECNIGPQHMDRGPQCSPERRREEELVFPEGESKEVLFSVPGQLCVLIP